MVFSAGLSPNIRSHTVYLYTILSNPSHTHTHTHSLTHTHTHTHTQTHTHTHHTCLGAGSDQSIRRSMSFAYRFCAFPHPSTTTKLNSGVTSSTPATQKA